MSRPRALRALALIVVLAAGVVLAFFLLLGARWSGIFPGPTAQVVLHASRTELQVNDTLTLTADIDAATAGGLGEPAHYVTFMDAPSDSSEPPRLVEAEGGYFYLDASQFLQLESIRRQDNRITAVFQAIRPGRTRVRVGVNGEVCETPPPGHTACNWNRITFESADLSIQVTDN